MKYKIILVESLNKLSRFKFDQYLFILVVSKSAYFGRINKILCDSNKIILYFQCYLVEKYHINNYIFTIK